MCKLCGGEKDSAARTIWTCKAFCSKSEEADKERELPTRSSLPVLPIELTSMPARMPDSVRYPGPLEELHCRMTNIEDQLARIESLLTSAAKPKE